MTTRSWILFLSALLLSGLLARLWVETRAIMPVVLVPITPTALATDAAPAPEPTPVPATPSIHETVPDEVRGLYWTAVTAGSSRGDALTAFMEKEGFNAVVIDLKLDDGEIAFAPDDPTLVPYAQTHPAIGDLDALLAKLKAQGIYRIARLPVMRDGSVAYVHPEWALHWKSGGLWQDNIGSHWLDPAVPGVSDTAIALAKEAYARGFDEVQFDYVRFPSDGAVSSVVYPAYDGEQSKQEVMAGFFAKLNGALETGGIPHSYDLFGMTCWSNDDYGIGQRLIDAAPGAEYISPMVYPSHFSDNFQGFANPAAYPYEIVNRSMTQCDARLQETFGDAKDSYAGEFRPWLQAFNIGAVYDTAMVKKEIQAARDAGTSGWILWNARNVYEELSGVLAK